MTRRRRTAHPFGRADIPGLAASVALLALALLLGVAATASASADTVVPASSNARTFSTSPGGWTSTVGYGGLGCVSLFTPCANVDWANTGGAGGAGDGYLRTRQDGTLNLLASVTGTWTSPTFTAPAVTDAGTLSMKLRPHVASLLTLVGGADLSVDLVSASPAQTIALASGVPLGTDDAWNSRDLAIPTGSIVAGRTYALRIRATLAAGVGAVTAASIGVDDVSLTLRDLLPPTGLTSSVTLGSPVTVNGSVDPHGASTDVTVAYGTSAGALTQTAGPVTVAGTGAQDYSIPLSGLDAGTTYHYRATATNADGSMSTSVGTFGAPVPPSDAAPVVNGSSRDRNRTVVYDLAGADSAVVQVTTPGGSALDVPDTPADGSVALTLPDEDGTYTVRVVRTTNGTPTTSQPVTATLDRQAPSTANVSLSVTNAVDNTSTRSVTLSIPSDAVGATAQVVGADGNTVGGPVDVSSGNASVSLGTSDGTFHVRITLWDSAGNQVTVTSQPLTLDSLAPSTAGANLSVTPAISPNRTRQVSLSVPSDAVSASAQVRDGNGVDVGPAVDVSSGAGTVQLGSSDGAYTVRVTLTDAAGNASHVDSDPLALDTDAPSLAGLNLDVTPAISNVRTRALSLAVPGDAVSARAQVIDVNGDPVGNDVDAASGAVPVVLGAADGTYRVRVTLRDAAGNEATLTGANVTLDTTAPALSSSDIDVTPVTSSVRPRQLTVNVPADAVHAHAQVVDSGGVGVGADVDVASGTATVTLGATDGTYRVRVTVRDAAGNERTALSSQLTLDTVAPPTTGLGLQVQPTVSPDRNRSLSLTLPAGATSAHAQVLDSADTPVGAPVDVSSGQGTVQLGATDGTYTVLVTLGDAAGNTSTATSDPLGLDTVAPSTAGLNIGVTPISSEDRARQVTFTMPSDAVAARLQALDSGGTPIGAPSSATSGAGTVTLPVTPGTYAVRVIVRDASGNDGSADSGQLTLLPDTTPPDPGPAPTWSGSHDDGTVSFYVDPTADGQHLEIYNSAGLLLTTVDAGRNVGWVKVGLPAAAGTYRLRTKHWDAAGNVSYSPFAEVTRTAQAPEATPTPTPADPGTGKTGEPSTGRAGTMTDPGGFGSVVGACFRSDLGLTSVVISRGKVALRGISHYAPGTAIRVLDRRGREAGTTTAGDDGWFTATVDAPARADRRSARYSVAVGTRRSRSLKLVRANVVRGLEVSGRAVTIRGVVDRRRVRGTLRFEVRGGHGHAACRSRAPRLRIRGAARVNRATGAYTLRVAVPAGTGPIALRTRAIGRTSSYSTYVVR